VIQNTFDGSTIKIANFQALIDDRYSHTNLSNSAMNDDITLNDKRDQDI
jgi:hypothetical protein